ncbi:DUF4836 family protein [Prolixibacteraceae bacterium]|nr:DUF4836 family protein [Prolixibacteraceae bacterium]
MNRVLLCLALVVSMIATSCSTGPKPTDVIPASSSFVASVDVVSLALKGGLQDMSSFNSFKMIQSGIDQQPEEVKGLINNILENPSETGLSFRDDIYVFLSGETKEDQYGHISMVIRDVEKFNGFINQVLSDENIPLQVVAEGEFNIIKADRDGVVIWNNENLIISAPLNYRSRGAVVENTKKLFALQPLEMITSVNSYNELTGDEKDFNYWISSNSLKYFDEFNTPSIAPVLKKLDGCAGIAHLDFKDGEVVIDTKVFVTDIVKETYLSKKDLKFDTKLYEYFPKENIIIIGSCIDTDLLEKHINADENMAEMAPAFQAQVGVDMHTALSTLGSSMMLSFSDVMISKGIYGRDNVMPELNLGVQLNKDQENKWILDLLTKSTRYDQDGYFVLNLSSDINIYFAVTDELFYVSNNEDNVRKAAGILASENTFASSDLANHFADTSGFIYVDLDYDHLSESAKAKIAREFDPIQMSFVNGDNALLKDMELVSDEPLEGTYTLHLKNNEENSFKQIINLIDKNLVTFIR